MFRSRFQLAAGVMARNFRDVLPALQRQVHAYPAGDKGLFNALYGAHFAHQRKQRFMIGLQIGADPGVKAGKLFAFPADFRVFPPMRYMLADGPPRSEIFPECPGEASSSRASFSTELSLRD